jgi:hypothetical protein
MNTVKRCKLLLAALLLGLTMLGTAQAQITAQDFLPESGFYWNPAEPGRGYAIEIQDRFLFITVYTYTEETNSALREALWFFAAGDLTPGQSGNSLVYRFSDEMFISSEGQCLECAFSDSVSTATGRPMNITFTSLTSATLVINGETIPIQRFWYSPSIGDSFNSLLGQWIFAIDCTSDSAAGNCYPSDASIQPFNGDFLELFELSNGSQTTVDGFRSGTAIQASGAYDVSENLYVIVVSETNDEFLAYYFFGTDFGTDRILGFAERFRPGDDLLFNGHLMWGQRISDRTYVEDAFGKQSDNASKDTALPRPGKGSSTLSRSDLQAVDGVDKARREQLAVSLNEMVRELEVRLLSATMDRQRGSEE